MPDIAILVSHDCDIAASVTVEPFVEAITGVFLPKEDGSFTHSKNARKLHLAVTERQTGNQRPVQLKATDKFQIGKSQIVDHKPSDNLFMAPKEREILRRWLAARYRRHAFPDAFEDRLNRVDDQLREILKKSTNHLRAILFDLDEVEGSGPTPEAPYSLDIYLLYATDANPNESLKVAQEVKVERAFQDKYKGTGQWREIELRSCEVISDEALKYSQYLQLKEWRSEDLSLRSEPSGPMTEENSGS